MNPITNIRNQNKLNERELQLGVAGNTAKSWHQKYADSAWIYIGGLPFDLNEGDIIAIFSQYGEIVNINLIRDHKTGKSKGFAFICYQDQRSTILSVDNFNGTTILGRMLRVDHVEQYKVPKYREDVDEETRKIWLEGCAPKPINAIIVDPADNDDVEDYRPRAKLDEFGLVPLDESGIDSELKAKIHEERKKEKRAKKLAKREAKRRRHEAAAGADNPQIADFDPTSGKKKPKFVLHDEKRDLGRSWKEQRKDVSDTPLPDGGANDDEFYGSNPHFNFSKDRKELPPAPTHNLRPDFEKAAWRDIEMWKMVRERERAARGEEKPTNWKEEEHYLPSRFRRE